MKFVSIENLSKKEISAKLKEAKGVSYALSTKFIIDSQWSKFKNLLPLLESTGFKEVNQEVGQFGSTKFFAKE